MRKIILISTLIIFSIFSLTACTKESVHIDDNTIIIETTSEKYDANGKSLRYYMDCLQADGIIEFVLSDGMVTEINGKANSKSSYWMLYTNDVDNANDAWGKLDYYGEFYGSAIHGIEDLIIHNGYTYIWAYQHF